jgi:hypothetical protein
VPSSAVEDLPRSATAAGLEVAGMSGFFTTMDGEVGFEPHASTLAAARERAARSGIEVATIDDLVRALRAAKDGQYSGCHRRSSST